MPVSKDRDHRVECMRGLLAFANARGMTSRAFAERLVINHATLTGWLEGNTCPTGPRWHLIRRVYDYTQKQGIFPDAEWCLSQIVELHETERDPSAVQVDRVNRAKRALAALRKAPVVEPAPAREPVREPVRDPVREPATPAGDALALFTSGGLAAVVRDFTIEAQERIAAALPSRVLFAELERRSRTLDA